MIDHRAPAEAGGAMKNQEWREPEPRVVESQSQTRNVAVSVRGRPVVIECCRDADVRSCSVEPGRTGVDRQAHG